MDLQLVKREKYSGILGINYLNYCRVQILKTKLVVSLGNSKQNLKNRVVKDFMMS